MNPSINAYMTAHTQGWRAAAPGSLMVMGEHAVLHGKRALVCAVNQWLTVTLTPRPDRDVRILSALGEDRASLDEAPVREPFHFVWSAVNACAKKLPGGCVLSIESEFPATIGFGSSAAVTVATLAVLDAWCGETLDRAALHRRATAIIQAVQGRGSGADAAASVYGGLVEYRVDPPKLQPLHAIHPITVIYSGYKMPTRDVIARVEDDRIQRPALFDGFFYEIDECVRTAVDAVCRDAWAEVGWLMDQNHALMNALGVNDDTLEEIAMALRAQPGILGAKISGSGLGDCVIGLGTADNGSSAYTRVPCDMVERGVYCETI